jgi:hypothetical protein
MLSGLAGLGNLPGTEQQVVEEAADKAEDIQEAVEDAIEAGSESNGAGADVGKAKR